MWRDDDALDAVGRLGRFDDGDAAQRLQYLWSLAPIEFLPALVAAQRGHQVGDGDVNRFEQAVISE
ncbi:MAG: hypothetical protein ISS49_14060 [Anaerolineae bacterium]|nr:hypothetical protein [Anaerolineae bacterium]